MKEIPLTQGKIAVVDNEDYEEVAQFKWHALRNQAGWYARREVKVGSKRTYIYLHRHLLSATESPHIDHKNGDGLDNQRHNLRPASYSQNQANAKPRLNKASKYKGVSNCGGKTPWMARIKYQGRLFYLGVFATPEKAARAYDSAALEKFGEFARLNFPI